MFILSAGPPTQPAPLIRGLYIVVVGGREQTVVGVAAELLIVVVFVGADNSAWR